jgi:hypothetical protein
MFGANITTSCFYLLIQYALIVCITYCHRRPVHYHTKTPHFLEFVETSAKKRCEGTFPYALCAWAAISERTMKRSYRSVSPHVSPQKLMGGLDSVWCWGGGGVFTLKLSIASFIKRLIVQKCALMIEVVCSSKTMVSMYLQLHTA